jgi:hypothetical protein
MRIYFQIPNPGTESQSPQLRQQVWNHAVLTLLFFFIGEESWDHSTVLFTKILQSLYLCYSPTDSSKKAFMRIYFQIPNPGTESQSPQLEHGEGRSTTHLKFTVGHSLKILGELLLENPLLSSSTSATVRQTVARRHL